MPKPACTHSALVSPTDLILTTVAWQHGRMLLATSSRHVCMDLTKVAGLRKVLAIQLVLLHLQASLLRK